MLENYLPRYFIKADLWDADRAAESATEIAAIFDRYTFINGALIFIIYNLFKNFYFTILQLQL